MRYPFIHFICVLWIGSFAVADLRFQHVSKYQTGGGTTGVFPADLDGDLDIDIAVANRYSNSVTVFYNDGQGSFETSVEYQTGLHPRYVEGADFDGDGDIDLCTPDYEGMTVSVLENGGSGSFVVEQQFKLFTPTFLWIDDLDSDGNTDIVTLHWDETANNPNQSDGIMTPLYGDGAGSFAIGESAFVGVEPRCGASADLNGDGFNDVVVADTYGRTISIVASSGPRTWEQRAQISLWPGTPRYLTLGDFDSDGDVDIAALDKLGDQVWFLFNDGQANFTLEQTVEVRGSPHSMSVKDVDGDGDLDFIVVHAASVVQLILYNDGTGHIESVQSINIPGGTTEVKVADFNDDSLFDIVTANVNLAIAGMSVLEQKECLGCVQNAKFSTGTCPPISYNQDAVVSVFDEVHIQLVGESFTSNTLDYIVTSLPTKGELRDPSGVLINYVPFYLTSDTVRYYSQNGYIGLDQFHFRVNDCEQSTESLIAVQVNPPYPDECNGAWEVENGFIDVSTSEATDSIEPFDTTPCDASNFGEMRNDIWLRYIACGAGELLVDACELNFDSDIVVYEGDCCNLSQIDCNGDAIGCNGSSSVVIYSIELGEEYFIRIGGAGEFAVGAGAVYIQGPTGPCGTSCIADATNDGVVDVSDLLLVIGNWGENCGEADINVDGIVDVVDLLEVIGGWGPCDG